MVSEWRGGGCPAKRIGLGWWIKGSVGVKGCEQQLLQLLIDLFFFKTFSFLWDVAVIYDPWGLQWSHIVHPALSVRCCCCFSQTNTHTYTHTVPYRHWTASYSTQKNKSIFPCLQFLCLIHVRLSDMNEKHALHPNILPSCSCWIRKISHRSKRTF